jgi:hypothetical protein
MRPWDREVWRLAWLELYKELAIFVPESRADVQETILQFDTGKSFFSARCNE